MPGPPPAGAGIEDHAMPARKPAPSYPARAALRTARAARAAAAALVAIVDGAAAGTHLRAEVLRAAARAARASVAASNAAEAAHRAGHVDEATEARAAARVAHDDAAHARDLARRNAPPRPTRGRPDDEAGHFRCMMPV
jgi:hypothetical protein